jgi:hypothetical protein
MPDSTAASPTIDEFFRRWEGSDAAERANYLMFLNALAIFLKWPDRRGRASRHKNACGLPKLLRAGASPIKNAPATGPPIASATRDS